MRLIRFGRQGTEIPGVLLDGKRRDLSAYFQDWNSTFFAESALESPSALLKADESRRPPEVSEGDRWGSRCQTRQNRVCGAEFLGSCQGIRHACAD
jgi:2,4-diketo-3-deoxy-L-fuconate hydrolase